MRNVSTQVLFLLLHPCNLNPFMQLRTLWRNGAQLYALESIHSELFLSQRGWYGTPLAFYQSRLTAASLLAQRPKSIRAVLAPGGCWKDAHANTHSRPNSPRHSMLYFAIQCTETPFRERFGAIPPTPVNYSL